MSEIEIRKVGTEEIDLLMEWRMEVLHHVFRIPEADDRRELYRANRAYYLSSIPQHTHVACFAYLDGKIVGCGGVCIQEEMPSPDNPSGRNAYLMNIYTRRQYRGRGIAGEIVDWLIGRARETGAGKIYLETSEAGRNLYRKAGFEPMKDYLKLKDHLEEETSEGTD